MVYIFVTRTEMRRDLSDQRTVPTYVIYNSKLDLPGEIRNGVTLEVGLQVYEWDIKNRSYLLGDGK